jgi:hypothetical protein
MQQQELGSHTITKFNWFNLTKMIKNTTMYLSIICMQCMYVLKTMLIMFHLQINMHIITWLKCWVTQLHDWNVGWGHCSLADALHLAQSQSLTLGIWWRQIWRWWRNFSANSGSFQITLNPFSTILAWLSCLDLARYHEFKLLQHHRLLPWVVKAIPSCIPPDLCRRSSQARIIRRDPCATSDGGWCTRTGPGPGVNWPAPGLQCWSGSAIWSSYSSGQSPSPPQTESRRPGAAPSLLHNQNYYHQ